MQCHPCAGNYDTYLQVRSELEDAQMKKHKWEQDQISHMKVLCFAAAPCLCKPITAVVVELSEVKGLEEPRGGLPALQWHVNLHRGAGKSPVNDRHCLMQEYIARFGHGSAKLARQAQSKEKTLEKMVSHLILPVQQHVYCPQEDCPVPQLRALPHPSAAGLLLLGYIAIGSRKLGTMELF